MALDDVPVCKSGSVVIAPAVELDERGQVIGAVQPVPQQSVQQPLGLRLLAVGLARD